MRSSLRLGRALGIPIEIHWSILAVVVLFTLNVALQVLPGLLGQHPADLRSRLIAALVAVILFFASILAHELGHALVALGQGVGVSGISLWVLGGMAQLDRSMPSASSELKVAAAGPAVSAVLGVFFGCSTLIANYLGVPLLIVAVGVWLAVVNIFLALFNLLPAAPLDGGRILTAILWRRIGDGDQARVIAGRCGLVLGLVGVLFGGFQLLYQGLLEGWMTVVVALFVFNAARHEIRSAVVRRRLRSTPVGRLLVAHPPPVPDSVTVRQLDTWASQRGRQTAYPVVRWDPRPVGYVVPGALSALPAAEASWTRLSQVMRPVEDVDRIGATETAEDVLDRWGDDRSRIGVVHDADPNVPIGTLTFLQVQSLLAWPDLWGRDRPAPADPAVGAELGPALRA